MRTANHIAEWIVRYSADELGAPVDPMSLEKLVYYAQAFYLALEDEPLFGDAIEAWKWGPVVPDVYRRYQAFGADPIVIASDAAISVSRQVSEFLEQVVDFFRRHTAVNLSKATHLETPWLDASATEDTIIPQAEMKGYYRGLMNEGEAALSRHELLDSIPDPRWSSYYVAGIAARRLTSHPFYVASLAKTLAEPTPRGPELPSSFFAPVKGRDFIEFSPDEDPDDVIRAARNS
ncbi:MAG: DUF4065 domain-containing protein [Xanthobacteraceae bacterium]|nr:DUF4065 domain-containing protein [Xanthobacteraceae bacterium]